MKDLGQGSGRDGERGAGETGSARRFDFGRVWRVAAFALLAAAAALAYLGHAGAAFFAAGLGASAWFINVRTNLIRKHDLVKVGGRNWRPRSEVEREEAAAEEDEEA